MMCWVLTDYHLYLKADDVIHHINIK